MADLIQLSKFLSLALCHLPEQFGLTPDSEGFVDLQAVWAQVRRKYGDKFTRADLDALLCTPGGQQRFEVKQGRIRALYGHSTVSMAYPPVVPPEILYHGAIPEAAEAIRREGLESQGRQYVHLSTSKERAAAVATRRGKPVILRIRALAAHHAGHVFHHPEEQHYWVESLPTEFIVVDDVG